MQVRISEEEHRREQWKRENIRRRHNYLPFIVELLKGLAGEGRLMPMYEKAKEKSEQVEQAKKAKKEAAK